MFTLHSIVETYGKKVEPKELKEVLRLECRSKLLIVLSCPASVPVALMRHTAWRLSQSDAAISQLLLNSCLPLLFVSCCAASLRRSAKRYSCSAAGLSQLLLPSAFNCYLCSIIETYGKKVEPKELEEVLRLEYRSKLLNPRWAQAMAAQGSGGAYEISTRMTALLGWGGTVGYTDSFAWDQVSLWLYVRVDASSCGL
jgi:hypothetical protein